MNKMNFALGYNPHSTYHLLPYSPSRNKSKKFNKYNKIKY